MTASASRRVLAGSRPQAVLALAPASARRCALASSLLLALLALAPAGAAAASSSSQRSAAAWRDVAGTPAPARSGARPQIRPRRFRALAVDRDELAAVLAGAPRARTRAARSDPLTLSLPAPGGGFERFAVAQSPVMEPGLAAKHPEIATYAGRGIDTPGATIRLDLTPVGFHASVRGPGGAWYVDPYYHADQRTYVSYRGADLVDDPHGGFAERDVPRLAAAAHGAVRLRADASTGRRSRCARIAWRS